MEFAVDFTEFGPHKILLVSGDLNMFNAQIFKAHGESVLGNPSHLAIDLTKVDYIDSSGMGALLHLSNLAKKTGRSFHIVRPNDRVKSLFELVKIDRVFKIVQSYEELD